AAPEPRATPSATRVLSVARSSMELLSEHSVLPVAEVLDETIGSLGELLPMGLDLWRDLAPDPTAGHRPDHARRRRNDPRPEPERQSAHRDGGGCDYHIVRRLPRLVILPARPHAFREGRNAHGLSDRALEVQHVGCAIQDLGAILVRHVGHYVDV